MDSENYKNNLLPGDLSAIIRVALADIQSEKNPDIVNMSAWFEHGPEKRCEAFLAGAVLYQTFGMSTDLRTIFGNINPSNLADEQLIHKLRALNEVREGHIKHALLFMHPNADLAHYHDLTYVAEKVVLNVDNYLQKCGYDTAAFKDNWPSYESHRAIWYETMMFVADTLETDGE